MTISSCGIDCAACKFQVEQNCPGCHIHQGNPFWGKCDLYACAAQKALPHCGKCGDFPCDQLVDAHNNENPDGKGIEIKNLRALLSAETE